MTRPPSIRAADDPRGKDATWMLMPVDTSHGECSQCARVHDPDQPHDQQALHWQYSFYAEHDRWPTWHDAMAHCDEQTRAAWIEALRTQGVDL